MANKPKIAIVYGEHRNETFARDLAMKVYSELKQLLDEQYQVDLVECEVGYDKSRLVNDESGNGFNAMLELDKRNEEWIRRNLNSYALVIRFHDGNIHDYLLLSVASHLPQQYTLKLDTSKLPRVDPELPPVYYSNIPPKDDFERRTIFVELNRGYANHGFDDKLVEFLTALVTSNLDLYVSKEVEPLSV